MARVGCPGNRLFQAVQPSGLITESDARPPSEWDDERRRYYALTTLGRKVAEAEAERAGGDAEAEGRQKKYAAEWGINLIVRGKPLAAEVASLPFVPHNYKR